MLRIVVDVDNVICRNWRRKPYDKAEPICKAIEKINYLKEAGHHICLFTSRGMASNNNDPQKAEERNRKTLEEWLEKNGVKYDELVFGKPLADLYIDDRAVNDIEFIEQDLCELHGGGSNRPIYRLCNSVKKDLGDDKNNFIDWIEDNKGYCNYPRVSSFFYDSVFMEYIDGENLCDCANREDIIKVMQIILEFSKIKYADFDLRRHKEIIEKNRSGQSEWDSIIDLCEKTIDRNIERLKANASFSHGDTILSNIIKKEGEYYFIDARYDRKCSSYLFDLAKLRNSLSDYEYLFGISKKRNSYYLEEFDNELKKREILDLVIILQLMYIVRLYRYKNNNEKEKVKRMANDLISTHREVFYG